MLTSAIDTSFLYPIWHWYTTCSLWSQTHCLTTSVDYQTHICAISCPYSDCTSSSLLLATGHKHVGVGSWLCWVSHVHTIFIPIVAHALIEAHPLLFHPGGLIQDSLFFNIKKKLIISDDSGRFIDVIFCWINSVLSVIAINIIN